MGYFFPTFPYFSLLSKDRKKKGKRTTAKEKRTAAKRKEQEKNRKKKDRGPWEEGVPARASEPGWPRVNLAYMQDKRRRNDFASTEVGEGKGGRVTQQAFEVAYKKDSGISMQRCQEREATGGRTPRKMARLKDPAPASFSVPLIFEKGRGGRPGRQSTTQAQGLKIFSSHPPPWHRQAKSRTAKRARQRTRGFPCITSMIMKGLSGD